MRRVPPISDQRPGRLSVSDDPIRTVNSSLPFGDILSSFLHRWPEVSLIIGSEIGME